MRSTFTRARRLSSQTNRTTSPRASDCGSENASASSLATAPSGRPARASTNAPLAFNGQAWPRTASRSSSCRIVDAGSERDDVRRGNHQPPAPSRRSSAASAAATNTTQIATTTTAIGDAERHESRGDEPDGERRGDRDRRERGNGRHLISGSRAAPREQRAGEQCHARADDDERRDDADDPRRPHRRPRGDAADDRDRKRGREDARERERTRDRAARDGCASPEPAAAVEHPADDQWAQERSEQCRRRAEQERRGRRRAGRGGKRRPGEAEERCTERREPQIGPPREQHDRGNRRPQASSTGAPHSATTGPRLCARCGESNPGGREPDPDATRHHECEPRGARVTERRGHEREWPERAGSGSETYHEPTQDPDTHGDRTAVLPAPGGEPAFGDDGAGGNGGERRRSERNATCRLRREGHARARRRGRAERGRPRSSRQPRGRV